ncbi:MAG TPA: hypothetical protein VGK59_21075 [Ohtaekwangia sp.]
MKRVFFIAALFGYSHVLSAQTIELLKDAGSWNEGSIARSDESRIEGLIKYDNRNEILFYNDGQNTTSLKPEGIIMFEFYDDSLRQQRTFYSLEQKDPETNKVIPMIFEVLRDYKSYAILHRVYPIEIIRSSHPGRTLDGEPTAAAPFKAGVEVIQKEAVLILDESGEIKPYFELITIERNPPSLVQPKNHDVINPDLLAEYIPESDFQKLKDYAREKELQFYIKDDLLKILEYYDSIRQD